HRRNGIQGYRSCARSSVFYKRSWLETDPRTQLKRPRAARAEHLSEPRSRLAEARAGEIAAVAGEVRGIVQVEDLADQRQPPAFAKQERAAQAQIERLKTAAE